jgi:hypothetical protein
VWIRKETYYELSDRSLLAMYLLVRTIRKGAYKLILSNDFFRSLWHVSRVYKKRLCKFAESKTIKTYFPRFRLGEEPAGGTFWMNNLILYVTEKDNREEDQKTEYVDSLPEMEEVYKELRVDIIETEVEIDGFEEKKI